MIFHIFYFQANTKERVWTYLQNTLLPELYPDKWFDLDKRWENDTIYDFPGFKYLNDMTSKIVTGARLRQLRVQPGKSFEITITLKFRRYIIRVSYYVLTTEIVHCNSPRIIYTASRYF